MLHIDPFQDNLNWIDYLLLCTSFTNFIFPGFASMLILGFGNIFVGIVTVIRWWFYPYVNILMGIIACGWIILQSFESQKAIYMNGIFFLAGLIQIICSIRILRHEHAQVHINADQ